MPFALIEKILDELEEIRYPNRFSLYNNNEPFLDGRIFDIVRLAREKLPGAYLELKSNGILLTTEKVLKIFNAGLDMLYINYYSFNGNFGENIVKIKKDLKGMRRFKGHLEGNLYFSRIKISLRNAGQILGTRAGTSPNKKKCASKYLNAMCLRPFEMMTISPNGEVSVCSEDFRYSLVKGNVHSDSLMKIWSSDAWNDLRYCLLLGRRTYAQPCSVCDYPGYHYELIKEHSLDKKILDRIGYTCKKFF
jgi:radical SAM protein with 4Fe4S-binding SPASM domain